MKIYDFEQGSDEWHEIRKLKLTASHATEIGNNGKGLDTYINKKIIALIVPNKERFYGKDMERGDELEPIARFTYEFEKGVNVREVGFIEHCKHSGYSPDGLVDEDYLDDGEGLIEIKCRNDEKHLALLETGKVESGVKWQMQMGMLITGRKWCDFISYNPNFKQSLFVKRFYTDYTMQEKIKIGLKDGIAKLKLKLKSDVVKKELV